MPRRTSTAARSDKYKLYQASVQDPPHDVRMFTRFYKEAYKAEPRILREDFCGTAAVCAAWARSKPERVAYGVDLDPEPLAWGREHNIDTLPTGAQSRVHLIQDDVRTARAPKADVLAAQNYSFFFFKQRAELGAYFKNAYRSLAARGIMVLDMMGGGALQDEDVVERRAVDGFTYVWDQRSFNPITHDALFHIHFRFRDGSELKKAFTYDWRIWTLPEVRELLAEAGFSRTLVYWQHSDEDDNPTYRRQEEADPDPAWLAYVVAVK